MSPRQQHELSSYGGNHLRANLYNNGNFLHWYHASLNHFHCELLWHHIQIYFHFFIILSTMRWRMAWAIYHRHHRPQFNNFPYCYGNIIRNTPTYLYFRCHITLQWYLHRRLKTRGHIQGFYFIKIRPSQIITGITIPIRRCLLINKGPGR